MSDSNIKGADIRGKEGGSTSIVLLSGGLDSTVTASIAASESGEVALLHVNYGQRTEERELKSFSDIASHLGTTKTLVADLSHLKDIGGSALTEDGIDVPKGDITSTGIPVTYVPFRNGLFLSVALSWAEVIGADRIYIGAVEEDSSGYPDCRGDFFRAFERAGDEGTKPETRVSIHTPLIDLSKGEIVKRGSAIGAPFNLTWSCYKDSDLACGECDSCLLRLKGFKEAGVKDPIPYRGSAP